MSEMGKPLTKKDFFKKRFREYDKYKNRLESPYLEDFLSQQEIKEAASKLMERYSNQKQVKFSKRESTGPIIKKILERNSSDQINKDKAEDLEDVTASKFNETEST